MRSDLVVVFPGRLCFSSEFVAGCWGGNTAKLYLRFTKSSKNFIASFAYRLSRVCPSGLDWKRIYHKKVFFGAANGWFWCVIFCACVCDYHFMGKSPAVIDCRYRRTEKQYFIDYYQKTENATTPHPLTWDSTLWKGPNLTKDHRNKKFRAWSHRNRQKVAVLGQRTSLNWLWRPIWPTGRYPK